MSFSIGLAAQISAGVDCTGQSGAFDARLAAVPHSTLTGVIAAVIFTGVVLIIKGRTSRRDIEHSRQNAMLVLVPSFVAMLVTSFCFAVVSGETDCLRADAATLSVGSLFAIAALGMLYGLAWLLDGFRATVPALSSIAGSLVYLVAVMVFMQMGLTALAYQQEYGDNDWVYGLLRIYVAVGAVLVFVTWIRWLRRREQRRMDARASARAISVSILISVAAFNLVLFQDANRFHADWAPVAAIVANVVSMLLLAGPFWLMLTTIPLRTDERKWGEARLDRRSARRRTQKLGRPGPKTDTGTGDHSTDAHVPDAPETAGASPETASQASDA